MKKICRWEIYVAVFAIVAAIGLAWFNRARHQVINPIITFSEKTIINEEEVIGANIVWDVRQLEDYISVTQGNVSVAALTPSNKRPAIVRPVADHSMEWGGKLTLQPTSERYLVLAQQMLKGQKDIRIPPKYRFPLKPINTIKHKQTVIFAKPRALLCSGTISFSDGLGRNNKIKFDGYVYIEMLFEVIDRKTGKTLEKKLINIREIR